MTPLPPSASGEAQLTLSPIGVVRCSRLTKVEAPRQPAAATGLAGTIELYAGRNFEHALEDLAGFERLWVLFWFHLNRDWRPKVLPPRSTTGRKGVFATRAPHRPNPLGLSTVRLERIDGLTLFISDVDMLDGTPVLDLKPYVPYTDAWPEAGTGWLGDEARGPPGTRPTDPVSRYTVQFAPRADEQAAWIEGHTGLPLRVRITAALTLGPQPHAYRRIVRDGPAYRLKVKDWRVRFAVQGAVITVLALDSGYRPAEVAKSTGTAGDPLAVHRDFRDRWGPPCAGEQ
ncbi:MAG: tRNA (N6-threonylcarbamoyladenosine(37)-N6)-methyltransferase TrmO [Gammaproteobacteria bacterium]|nr:tRNA (N6-threonylcarbamoyladenosine(37)-N6)-methyltransferase TrmO [Gammaproteobacteria bacterium]